MNQNVFRFKNKFYEQIKDTENPLLPILAEIFMSMFKKKLKKIYIKYYVLKAWDKYVDAIFALVFTDIYHNHVIKTIKLIKNVNSYK